MPVGAEKLKFQIIDLFSVTVFFFFFFQYPILCSMGWGNLIVELHVFTLIYPT